MGISSNFLGANAVLLVLAAVAIGAALFLAVRRVLMSRRQRLAVPGTGLVDVDQVQPPELSLGVFGRYPVAEKPQLDQVPQALGELEAARKGVAPAPKRKLFLSWAAVHLAVRSGRVTEEELDQCLFCTSVGELNLAEEFDSVWFDRLHPAFAKAAKHGRLICNQDREHYNATAIWEVNLLLQRNGVAPLTCVDQMGTLEQIPMYSCVPSVSDGSLEVLWATHPLRGDWRRAWGRSLEEIDQAFADLADEPERPSSNWMDELNKQMIDEARRKFENPDARTSGEAPHHFDNAYWTPGPDAAKEFGAFMGGDDQPSEAEEEDPADYWKKGRPQDEE